MQVVEERIYDRHVLKLLSAMLRAGVMEDGVVRSAVTGTPQGGVVSPLLCNVYLNRLDRQWNAKGVGKLVRYADLSRHPHKSAYAEVLIMPRMVGTACV
jgi:RNA-directed DNA polymerase